MNKNFENMIKKSGKSLNEISAGSGVPYTTINQLANGKRNINKVATETVMKLALFFETDPEDILNPINYIENISGKTMGYKYKWYFNDGQLYAKAKRKNDEITIQLDGGIAKPYIKYHGTLVKMYLKDILKERQFHEMVTEYIKGKGR